MRKSSTNIKIPRREKVRRIINGSISGKTKIEAKDSNLRPTTTFTYITVIVTYNKQEYQIRFLITINLAIHAIAEVIGDDLKWNNKEVAEAKENLWDEVNPKARMEFNKFLREQEYGSWDLETYHVIKIDGDSDLSKIDEGPIDNGFGRTLDISKVTARENKYSSLAMAKHNLRKICDYLYFLNKRKERLEE